MTFSAADPWRLLVGSFSRRCAFGFGSGDWVKSVPNSGGCDSQLVVVRGDAVVVVARCLRLWVVEDDNAGANGRRVLGVVSIAVVIGQSKRWVE
jgi:hypothetical protein